MTQQSKTPASSNNSLSLIAAFAAYAMWGGLPIYWKTLDSIPSPEILLHRILWSFAFLCLLTLGLRQVGATLQVAKEKRKTLLLLGSSILLTVNWLIYIWAVNNEFIVEASLGYFLTPIFNMLFGVIIFKDRPSRIQWFAIFLAASGVLCQLIILGTLPLIALGLALTFAGYAVLRKINPVEAMPGLFWETLFMLPAVIIGLGYIANSGQSHFTDVPMFTVMLLFSGVVTTVPLIFFTYSAKRLSLITLGLLQYTGPSISLLIGIFMYGELVNSGQVISFILIWSALIVYTTESFRLYRQAHKQAS